MDCKCGCGQPVKRNRAFVNKEHQLEWMSAGGAKEIGALQPIESKRLGGQIAGTRMARSGALAQAGRKGAARAREIAAEWRAKRERDERDG